MFTINFVFNAIFIMLQISHASSSPHFSDHDHLAIICSPTFIISIRIFHHLTSPLTDTENMKPSPGLRPGDEILKIGDRWVDEVNSTIIVAIINFISVYQSAAIKNYHYHYNDLHFAPSPLHKDVHDQDLPSRWTGWSTPATRRCLTQWHWR